MANKKNKKLMKKTNIFLQLFYYHYYLPLNLNFFFRRNRDEISNLFVSKYVFRILNISSIIFAQLWKLNLHFLKRQIRSNYFDDINSERGPF